MKLREFIKSELSGWGKYERIIFPLVILLIIATSFILNDSKIALVSAICGISYTILAGRQNFLLPIRSNGHNVLCLYFVEKPIVRQFVVIFNLLFSNANSWNIQVEKTS